MTFDSQNLWIKCATCHIWFPKLVNQMCNLPNLIPKTCESNAHPVKSWNFESRQKSIGLDLGYRHKSRVFRMEYDMFGPNVKRISLVENRIWAQRLRWGIDNTHAFSASAALLLSQQPACSGNCTGPASVRCGQQKNVRSDPNAHNTTWVGCMFWHGLDVCTRIWIAYNRV